MVARWRYEMTHTVFGNRRFGFDGRGADVFKRWLIVFAAAYVPIIIATLLDIREIWEWFESLEEAAANEESPGRFPISPASIALLVFAFTAGMLAFYWYAVWQFRYLVAHTYLGETSFRSQMRARTFIGYLLAFFGTTLLWGAVLAGIVVGLIYLAVPAAGTGFWGTAFGSPLAVIAAISAYLLAIAGMYLLSNYWLIYRPARHIAMTLTIINLAAVESIAQAAAAGPRFGEGLADAFDIGAV
jgi:uncharacterized membrane protein YjgN (DUF898 family)